MTPRKPGALPLMDAERICILRKSEHIRAFVDAALPLSPNQRARLAALLNSID